MSKAAMALLGARVVGNHLREQVRPVRVTSAAQPPPSVEAITPQWLTAVLCGAVPGAAVEHFEVVGGSDGTSSRRALRVHYNAAGVAANLPDRLFTKSASSLGSRLFLVLGGVTETETIFYRQVRPDLGQLRSPRAFHAASDRRTFRSIVLMEDLAAAGWSFPDPMQEQLNRRDLEDMVDQMAYYHATFWDSPRLRGDLAILPTTEAFQRRLNDLGIERRARVGIERVREITPPSVYRRKNELVPAVMRSLELNSRGTPTLLHQDVHQGNWLRDPEGRMGLYDWQCVARGEWALDLSYALSVNLPTEDRRVWEQDLLDRYLWRLGEEGVPKPPTKDEALLRYRQQQFHIVMFTLLTIGAGKLQPAAMQPMDYMQRAWKRVAAFLDDHDCLDSLR
jgi:hypothetical protein